VPSAYIPRCLPPICAL